MARQPLNLSLEVCVSISQKIVSQETENMARVSNLLFLLRAKGVSNLKDITIAKGVIVFFQNLGLIHVCLRIRLV